MKLFTFSGISGSLFGLNAGSGMIRLGRKVAEALAPAVVRYTGTDDADHFRSYINYGVMLGQLDDVVRLTGSTVLNEEAHRLAPRYAAAMVNAAAADPEEEILMLAHSQGTNNLTWTLMHLARNDPAFFTARTVRCVLFDPKVGRNHMEQIFGRFPPEELSFLFFQSENDVLGDQGMLIPKFLTEFPHGNHIWVRGLDHSSIYEWDLLGKPQYWLDLFGFAKYSRAWRQQVLALKQETKGGQLGTMQLAKLERWKTQYARTRMNSDRLVEALLGFLRGKLPAKFRSRE